MCECVDYWNRRISTYDSVDVYTHIQQLKSDELVSVEKATDNTFTTLHVIR